MRKQFYHTHSQRNASSFCSRSRRMRRRSCQAQNHPLRRRSRKTNKTDIPAAITTSNSVETRLGTLKFTDGFPHDATGFG